MQPPSTLAGGDTHAPPFVHQAPSGFSSANGSQGIPQRSWQSPAAGSMGVEAPCPHDSLMPLDLLQPRVVHTFASHTQPYGLEERIKSSVSAFHDCITNHYKLSGLKQHLSIVS